VLRVAGASSLVGGVFLVRAAHERTYEPICFDKQITLDHEYGIDA
jgi:hypothetical protein